MASSLMRPWHFEQARRSTPKVRARSSAHGRYPPGRFGVSGSVAGAASGGGLGAMRDLQVLAGASTPAYLTVWNRGGGTLVASRQLPWPAGQDHGLLRTASAGGGRT